MQSTHDFLVEPMLLKSQIMPLAALLLAHWLDPVSGAVAANAMVERNEKAPRLSVGAFWGFGKRPCRAGARGSFCLEPVPPPQKTSPNFLAQGSETLRTPESR